MLKLGWTGGSLGVNGTGLQTPITALTMYRGRMGLGGELAFPDLPPENQAYLRECEVCGGPVPKQMWEEHCAGRKHQRKLATKNAGMPKKLKRRKVVVAGEECDDKEVVIQAAQRFCEACKRACPIKAWSMHCLGKKHLTKLASLSQAQQS